MQRNKNFSEHFIQTTELWLLPEKCVFLPEKKILLVADVHLGKVAYFRRHGIGLPADLPANDLQTLSQIITYYQVKQVVFLGDLFHSKVNTEWVLFANWLEQHLLVDFVLTEGNHDKHARQHYPKMLTVTEQFQVDNIILTHEPLPPENISENKYNLHGHLHPAVVLKGKARQSARLPAFIFNPMQGILPAFGSFTGMTNITLHKHTRVFGIAEQKVIRLA